VCDPTGDGGAGGGSTVGGSLKQKQARPAFAGAGAGGLMAKVSMDILIEALFQAVLSEENKPLSVRHQQVKDRILEAEGAIRQWTKPKLSDPNNERVLSEFRERLRQRLERGTTQAIGGTASYLIDVLRILPAKHYSEPNRSGA
jgi:hypothetical protein